MLSTNDRKASPVKSQVYGHLNETFATCQHGWEKSHKVLSLNEELQAVKGC